MFVRCLKDMISWILLYLALSGIIFLYAYFTGANFGKILYPFLLCTLIFFCFLLVKFLKVKEKHESLSALKDLSADIGENLPPARTLLEEDYQAILRNLENRTTKELNAETEKYNDMIDYYTMWVHQIKSPIAGMSLLLQNQDSKESRELSVELRNIEQYVQMVLAFTRLGSASSDYVFRKQPLDPIIREAVRKYACQFIEKKIALEYEVTDAEPVTDEKWLAVVIEQILSNALKYTKEGGKIRIEVRKPGTLVISDSGIGISPADLPRVTEKSYTGRNGRLDKNASGIGLYLCKTILDRLGHKMSIESEVGKGTSVYLDLSASLYRD